jgi:hypothetical protein
MDKPILNVYFHGFWDCNEVIYNHYFKNSHRFLFEKYDVRTVHDPGSCDVILCSVFGQGPLPADNKPKILLIHENMRPQHAWFEHFNYIISFTRDLEYTKKHFRIPYWIYRFYEHNLQLSDLQRSTFVRNAASVEAAYVSRRFCNFVYSNPVEFRRSVAHELARYRQVDFGGKVDTNISESERSEITPSLLGTAGLAQKKRWLSKYRFTFAFENSSTEGYTTEKILDAFVAGSVPLYWGNLRIKNDGFNNLAFVNYAETPGDAFFHRVKSLDQNQDEYMDMVSQPVFKDPPIYLNKGYMLDLYEKMIQGTA